MQIYFVRHGQTKANQAQIIQGPDEPLAPEGEIQADKLAARLQHIALDAIWSSPMKRARQTADVINAFQHVEIVEQPELAEIKTPTSLQGKSIGGTEVQKFTAEFVNKKRVDPNYSFEDSESYVQVIARARALIHKLEAYAQTVPEDFVLGVTTHGLILNTILLCILLPEKTPPDILLTALYRMWQGNTGISVGSFGKEGWKIFTIGDVAHL